MRILDSQQPDFNRLLEKIIRPMLETHIEVEGVVEEILKQVKQRGDQALIELGKQFDRVLLKPETLAVSPAEMEQAVAEVSAGDKKVLEGAARRIEAFHVRQKEYIEQTWYKDEPGIRLGQLVRPIERVGLYVPGGKAVYPSSVFMNAIPAIVAGVKEIVICSPPNESGGVSPYILVAAQIAGVNKIYKLGGAQAVAAMAYGTRTIPRVDKIVGPGNIYVATAKRLVSDCVGIDMFAGPSEVLIIADESANPKWVAADLVAQAEHDAAAQPILVTTSKELAEQVNKEQEQQRKELGDDNYLGRAQAKQALERNGAIIIVPDTERAIELANQLAPEHLQLMLAEPDKWLGRIKHAGAVFLGHYSPTALGDYIAGPNHVLPTAGTARFASPLGVYDFIKHTSVIYYDQQALRRQGKNAVSLAEMEGLHAHAAAVRMRLE
jgi:histidinol dehydrogenase